MTRKKKNLLAYLNAYSLKKYKNVKISPKIVDDKALSKFTKDEKKALTVKGKRWYVYFDFIDPDTGKFKRQTPITAHTNRDYANFNDRYKAIHLLKQSVLELLDSGFDPYNIGEEEPDEHNIIEGVDFALKIKKDQVAPKTFESYKGSAKQFKEWLTKHHYQHKTLAELNRRMINGYLDHIARKTSNRNRNNHKNSLSSLFAVLVEYEYLEFNLFDSIKNLKTEPKRDPTYSDKQVEQITAYLKENDKVLLMFIYFVSYLFWRPKENCRLRVKDINIEEKLISVPTKTKGYKTKRIPDILLDDLREYLKGANPDDLVFTPSGTGQWDRQLDNRRHYFSDRYRKVKKHFGLMEYSIYSFRHYSITKAYKILRGRYSKDKALDQLSQVTGHDSKAIKAYIHYVDAETIDDYSHLLK